MLWWLYAVESSQVEIFLPLTRPEDSMPFYEAPRTPRSHFFRPEGQEVLDEA